MSCASDATGNVTFTYTDTAGAGDDTIKASFTDTSDSLQSATAQRHWVTAANRAPVANGQSVTTAQDTAVAVTLTGSDPDGNPITFATVTGYEKHDHRSRYR